MMTRCRWIKVGEPLGGLLAQLKSGSILSPVGVGKNEDFVGAAVASIGNFFDQHHGVRTHTLAEILNEHLRGLVDEVFLLRFREGGFGLNDAVPYSKRPPRRARHDEHDLKL